MEKSGSDSTMNIFRKILKTGLQQLYQILAKEILLNSP